MVTDDALSDVMERSPQSGLGTVPVTGPSGVALVFVIAFSFVALAALAIELVSLPHILPSLHAGHGLMVGHDSVEFQTLAEAMAERIRAQGWSAWKLSPADAGVIGIVAAAYTLTGVHEPYVLVPIYAALYAVCTTCVYRITLQQTGHMRGAWIAAAAFLLFPSATMIYAAMHKDAWSCRADCGKHSRTLEPACRPAPIYRLRATHPDDGRTVGQVDRAAHGGA